MKLGISWLDFKLGFRMLLKYPGLTLVGGLAIAFAIAVGAATFEVVTQVVHPTLPLEDGDRIVGIQNRDLASAGMEKPTLHGFVTWRGELDSVEDLGAFRTLERNLITGEGRGEPVEVAAISASGFDVARVPPLLGRTLVEADEQPGAPRVAVIGYDVWQDRFAGDPDIVGREVRLGSEVHTVVGVMPEGFAFPISHRLWVPLRLDVLDYRRGEAARVRVFGRLAPGATLEEARAELTAIGERVAAEFPDTHEYLRPDVMPYAKSIWNVSGLASVGIFASANLFLVMLLALLCGNVALLLFARAAARENELVVRNALGASRGRIIGQLFAEALVLAGVAAVVGLVAANFGLRSVIGMLQTEIIEGEPLPFWFSDSLSPATVLYAGLLAVLGAAIAGVVPALKVTRGVGVRLRQATPGGGGFRFGGIWTVVIVAQVAVMVVFPVFAFMTQRESSLMRSLDVGFREEEYLSVRLEMGREILAGVSADTSRAAFLARFHATYEELEQRLSAEPGVIGVTFAERLPRMYHPHRRIEVDEGGAAPPNPEFPLPGYRVSGASVAVDYFEVLNAPVLSGRGFGSGDLEPGARTVIVNQSFVERVLGGRNPIGRRVRYLYFEEWDEPSAEPGPWYEIVGVVRDLGTALEREPKSAGIYHPLTRGGTHPIHMAVHVRGDPASFAPRLRRLATAVDPALQLHELMPIEEIDQSSLQFLAFWFWLIVVMSSIALLLSLAGIYAVMAFTVSQRTREIGIRVALGAEPRRIVAAIFRRPLVQVGIGLVAGGGLAGAIVLKASVGVSVTGAALFAAYAALMLGVCMLACIVPTRRALRVEPTEALKAE